MTNIVLFIVNYFLKYESGSNFVQLVVVTRGFEKPTVNDIKCNNICEQSPSKALFKNHYPYQ